MLGVRTSRLVGAIGFYCFSYGGLSSWPADAAIAACEPVVGELVSVEGTVQLQRAGAGAWQTAGVGVSLCDKDTVRTEANSRAAVSLVNDAVFRIDQNTAIHLADIAPEPEEKSFVELLVGAIQSFSRSPRELAVDTPYLNATIEGTEFVIRVAQNETELTVFEGTVQAANNQGEAAVTSGQMVVAQAGGAPERRIVVRPRDAAQWSIYYPPVLAALGGESEAPQDLPSAMADAVRLAGRGDAAGALDSMDRVPSSDQDARYHLYRASFLLAAGQADQARAAIDRALQLDSGSGLAYAQRTVIDVAQNRKEEALANGRRAVELSPDSPAASIALSYALQANYQLGEARQTLENTVTANPNDALARARLAELWLMIGYRDRARMEAEKAVELQPGLERAQVVLGFAALTEIRTAQAKAAFEKAIALDSDDPMPHLGLGLAMIREGDLAEGRKRIEAAVALDPENALLRSYLGKAYFEEKREDLDAQQLALAKERDPNDPTPYLYDALRKQSENRPVEALQDLQKSIELNDNRAVYRGRLQLDEDRAARGASLARVYSDLGFTQLGLNEATKSLSDDPTNAGGHRFLSDTYAGMRRREISRVSEQLQAQLLQDININPVSPSGSETNLNVVSGGAAGAGFNEYTALFERNQAQFDAGGSIGTDDTWTAEGVVSAVYDRLSLSVGAYHYETDGWRQNHEIEHDIQNIYAQAALTPELNLQLEYRNRETTHGDIAFTFDPTDFDPDATTDREQAMARGGLRWSPTPNSDVLVSLIYSDQDSFINDVDPVGIFSFFTKNLLEDSGYQAETQYLYRGDGVNVTVGGGYTDIDREFNDSVGFVGFCPAFCLDLLNKREITHTHGYLYVNVTGPETVTWTVGAGYDNFKENEQNLQGLPAVANFKVNSFNPKLGVQWDITPDLRLRGALFKTVKPALVANRTIEPTQVAGFNQFFDDNNATESWRYGGALDGRVTDDVFAGIEATWREFDTPSFSTFDGTLVGVTIEDQEEQTHRAYVNWTPLDTLALNAEFVYDRFESQIGLQTDTFRDPAKLTTISVPVEARYFHPSGVFASLGGTFVDQDVKFTAASGLTSGSDEFVIIDAAIGFRLPKRAGAISLGVQNLLDEDFKYHDDSFREFQDSPSIGPYIPGRTILGRVNLRF